MGFVGNGGLESRNEVGGLVKRILGWEVGFKFFEILKLVCWSILGKWFVFFVA